MAEALNSLYKHELIYRKGPWRSTNAVEIATAEWVHWYNTSHLHGELDHRPTTEVEDLYWQQHAATETEPALQNK